MKVLDGLMPDPPKGWYWQIKALRKRDEVRVSLMPHNYWKLEGKSTYVSTRKEVFRDWNYSWEPLSQRELAEAVTRAAEDLLARLPDYLKRIADEKEAKAMRRNNRKVIKSMVGVYR